MDCFHKLLFENLISSKDETISGISKKAIKEVNYHLKRSSEWMTRLGLGTEESNEKLQAAVDELWMYTDELFIDNETDVFAKENHIGPLSSSLKKDWAELVTPVLENASIKVPENNLFSLKYGKNGFHTEYLGYILAEMQHLPLLYPDAIW
jgi:ring-1,2-phenylacetyl-CoA epoxidase subunit PaaC